MPTKSNILIGPAQPNPATYHAALQLVARIDDDQSRGVRHYRSRGGQLLMTLDQVVEAILADDLATVEPVDVWEMAA